MYSYNLIMTLQNFLNSFQTLELALFLIINKIINLKNDVIIITNKQPV